MAERTAVELRRHLAGFLVVLVTVGLMMSSGAAPALAAAAPEVQAETFAKIFRYDRQLGDIAGVEVLFVHPAGAFEQSRDTILSLARAFAQQRLGSRGIAADTLEGVLSPNTVAYLLPGTATPEVIALVAANGSLSIGPEAAMAERGEVGVALGRERQGRLEIVVNLSVLASQGHDLPAQMLKLARVVGATGAHRPETSREYSEGDSGVSAPTLQGYNRPPYPPLARRLGVEGTVLLRVLVDPTGKVMEVEVVSGVPQEVGIDEAAVEAAWTGRFRPGTKDGEPAFVWTTMEVPFTL